MRSIRAFLLLLCCSACLSQYCNKTITYFESRNFYSMLRWDKIEIPGREVHYSVWFSEYGSQLVPLTKCQNITEPSCDISYVIKRFHSRHFAKIMVDGICVGKYLGFTPFEETILEAPKVSVIPRESSIAVTLTEPMGPQNRSITEFFCWAMCKESTPLVNYIVYLTHPESESGKKYQDKSGTMTINHLQPNIEYCGVALYQLAHPATQKLSENTTFCVTLPDKTLGLWIYFVILGPVALVMIILGLVVCQLHLRRKRDLPKVLTHIMSKSNSPILQAFPDPKIDLLSICTEAPRNLVQAAPGLLSLVLGKSNRGCYVSQKSHNQAWHCRSYVNQEVQDPEVQDQTCNNSGTSYSMVVGVLKSFASDSGIGDSISPGLESCPGDDCDVFQEFCEVHPDRQLNESKTDAYANTDVLCVPTSRTPDGQLVLESLPFKPLLPSITESDQLTLASMSVGENTPFLAFHDSGFQEHPNYARTYLPNVVPEPPKTDSDCGTNYRQNWVPGMLPEIPQKDRTYMLSAHSLNEPEVVVEEPKAGFGAIFLDGWMVQIQG